MPMNVSKMETKVWPPMPTLSTSVSSEITVSGLSAIVNSTIWDSDMDIIDFNLDLINRSKRYEISKNSEGNRYSVYDKESILAAFYTTSDKKWTYGVSDVCNSPVSFVEVPVEDFNSLTDFTRLLSSR